VASRLTSPELRFTAVLALLAWALRLLFVLRRPDLISSGGDAALGAFVGALLDLGLAASVAALAALLHRLHFPRLSLAFALVVIVAAAAVAGIETEYFAFGRNRFDATFIAYAREWRTLGGSISGEASRLYLLAHAALALLAVALLVRLRSPENQGHPARALPLLAAGVALSFGLLAHPRQAETWFGAIDARQPEVELVRALHRESERVTSTPKELADAFATLRTFTDPLHSKQFLSDDAPLAHRGGAAPAGAFGPRPPKLNVLFVMMEGMEAASLAPSGGTAGLTPALDRLAAENLYFSRFFANGAHTPRALDASLCGLAPRLVGAPLSRAQPSMPVACLPALLRDRGYATSFIHGGMEAFENRFEFLGHIGFRETIFFEQFGANLPRANGGWGATDAQIYDHALDWLDHRDADRPFFLTVLSISNHHPFHVPDPALELDHDEAHLSNNTIRYADREVGRFVEALRARGLLENTVVFLFGDHGLTRSNLNADRGAAAAEGLLSRANVPLVVVGPPGLLPRRTVDRVASQNDLLPTVLDLVGADPANHAMGHSLGWTWSGPEGHDLPAFLHDLYSQLGAVVGPATASIVPLEDGARTEAAGTWSWSFADARAVAVRAPVDATQEATAERPPLPPATAGVP
jgi:phosphoglycerol transferase MdoB-like AlkP superfamily enzyme